MIAELVFFDLPPGTDRAAALALYRDSARTWVVNPELVEKFYVFDAARRLGGGVYVWRSREAAERWHNEEYRAMIRSRYGVVKRGSVMVIARQGQAEKAEHPIRLERFRSSRNVAGSSTLAPRRRSHGPVRP